MLKKIQSEGQTNDLRSKLLEIYNLNDHQKMIKNMNDDEILELGNNLKEGIPFATPVFDGAKEKI